jgi:hypothetical protein
MAEFKLDRIRFRYRGDWNAATNYVKDDTIRFGAKVYVCIEVHQSDTNFYNDLNNAVPRWVQMMDGQSWTGDWKAATFYRIGDLVKLGGVIYKCIEGHTSNTSADDGILGDELKWVYFARGENWTSVWTPDTLYNVDDSVLYGSTVYKCLVSHTSATENAGLEFDAEKWTTYAPSDNFRGEWTASTHYYIDDIVRYGGILYRAIGSHISTPDSIYTNPVNTYANNNITDNPLGGSGATFEIYRSGANYYAKILTAGTGYSAQDTFTVVGSLLNGVDAVNDCVITIDTVNAGTGAIESITVTGLADALITYGLEIDSARWETVMEGIAYKDAYAQYTHYRKNDIVKWSPGLWKCITTHFASGLYLDESNFEIYVPGLEYESVWNDTQYYQQGDIVLYGGYSYKALQSNVNSQPAVTDSTGNWELIFPGYTYRGEWVGQDAVEGVPTDREYKTGDVVLAGGNLYIAVRDNANLGPDTESVYDPGSDEPFPWQLLVTGKRWKGPWKELTDEEEVIEYFPGDVVTVAGTLYACIDKHTASSSDSKPTLDFESENVGPYWVLLAQGSPGNVLEYSGDIKTQNDDSTRLRIGLGTPGQLNKVTTGGFPGWGDFEKTVNVYYVAPEGADTPDNGLIPSAPFKSIKYACEYVQESIATRTPATIFIRTGFFEEQLPIKVPRDTALVGDELRSTNVRPKPGFETSNMFYVNNGSGIRNMSLQGLRGTLGDTNQYGTRRPSAGAYVSLDPGTGPTDATVWITNKSCYVQNVSTFGTGCIGMKVDGDLHNGGNKSIVANDFTQILDQGIGFWVNGEGKSELVSVFTYYNHIGYLATNGGKVRATNGNNSYGDFGSVAEGVASDEDPITCKINNRIGQAVVDSVYNDENEIYAFAFTHGGENYTEADITIEGSGEGASASIKYENTRDGSVKEVRIMGPDDSSPAGGATYTQIDGTARSGSNTEIELAAQLSRPASEIEGQRIYIREGRGRGQYAYIDTFDEVSKVATVKREWDDLPGWQHLLGGFPIEIELDASTKYVIEPRITFSNPPYSATINSVGNSGEFAVGEYRKIGSSNVTVVIGNGTVRRTTDGTNWTTHGAASGQYVDTAASDQWFFAVASDGKVIRSQDGATWSEISGQVGTDVFRGVAAYDTHVVIASETGVVYTSNDEGATWTSSQVVPYDGSTPVFTQAAGGNGMFLLTNLEGETWESADDGYTWRRSTNIGANKYRVSDLMYGGGKFVAAVQDSPLDDSTSPNKFFVTTATNASIKDNIDPEYNNGALKDVEGDGSEFFAREVTVNGVRIMAAGDVGGQDAVPDAWLEKVARMFELFTDKDATGINENFQREFIQTLSGDAGTSHAGLPTLQRVARGAGADYTPNFLTDEGIASYNLSPLFDSHVANDMVWYLNSTGDGYGDGEIDAQEVIEHVFHTLHMHGLPNDMKIYPQIQADWASGPTYAAMEEAFDGGFWDPSGYQSPSNAWKTDADAFEVAVKEYLFLLNFCMFDYSDLWEGDSLAPEWADSMRTPAGILANNPLGHSLFNSYMAPIISKPTLSTILNIFKDGNTPAQDDPALAGVSGYAPSPGTAPLTRWQESATPPHSGPYYVSYSQGVYVAITQSGETAYSQDAMVWLELDNPLGGTFQGITAGRNNGAYFVPIESGSQSQLNTIKYGARPLVRVITNAGRISKLQIFEPGSGYASAPTVTLTDNKNILDAVLQPRLGDGVLTQPTFTNRGTGFLNVTATVDGDGFKDQYQIGKVINVSNLSREPGPGDLLFIDGINDQVYRVTQINNLSGSEPVLNATLRISPSLKAQESPDHETNFTIRQNYSQVRLTGHDFLDIGTGGQTTTNYPELYTNAGFTEGYEAQPFREVKEAGGGRVFYTSTDQDGNFRVGELFEVEQATGIVTLNADLFNLQGLSELALGGVVLGGTEVVIREFSTDPTMAANSDNAVPTQKAIVTYINSRVSGGGSNLNVSRVRAGQIRVETNNIFNEADPVNGTITFPVTVFMNKGFNGGLLALSFFTGGVASTELNEGDPVSAIDDSNGYGN